MTAAVALGPEYGTVGKELVREANKEAAEFADAKAFFVRHAYFLGCGRPIRQTQTSLEG
jgi:hypothetical protein